jgi:hypothetical protein
MIVELTDKQRKEVAPLIEKATNENESGSPGIVIAQVFKGKMIVGFLPHEKAKLLEKSAFE